MPPDTMSSEAELESGGTLPTKCSQCNEKPARYRCPGCSAHTCGLDCVKAHKTLSGCSGKRSRTAFVALQEFDDKNLVSDYTFLEEVSQENDAAKRMRMQIGVQGPPRRHEGLPPGMRALQLQAQNRGVTLRFLSPGMTQRVQNSSFFDRKRKCLFWRVEWQFREVDVTLVDGKCDENTVIREAVGRQLSGGQKPGGNQQSNREKAVVYAKAGVEALRFFIRKEPSPANEERFVELDGCGTFRSELESLTIIEFPRVYVAMSSEAHLYPTVKIERRRQHDLKGTMEGGDILGGAKRAWDKGGKVYREEEIGGGERDGSEMT